MTQSNNKRIAKNTMLLYFRMAITMLVSLYTSRIVLSTLGEVDFGIYNIVGGLVVFFAFLKGALNSATQRFLNFYLGKRLLNKAKEVFVQSINIYIILSIIFFILAETVGLWFLETKLNIPENRRDVAFWVYQISVITFIISILTITYNATIISYEKMSFYAYLSIIEVTLKLVIVYLLIIAPVDRLLFYSVLLCLVQIIITTCYILYCKRNFSIANYNFKWYPEVNKELFGFSTWSVFSSIANMISNQGISILLNIFYGVTINAAAGIANQVCTNVYHFITNFQTAFNPQIVKYYASGETNNLYALIFNSSKYSFYIMWILTLPLLLSMDHVLLLWLGKVPLWTSQLCQCLLISMLIESLVGPFWAAMQATGKIRNYSLVMSSFIFLNFPFSYLVLKMGLPPYSVWCVRIVINLLLVIVRLIFLVKYICFPMVEYLKNVGIKVLGVVILSVPISLLLNTHVQQNMFSVLVNVLLTLIITILTIYFIGLTSREKDFISNVIHKK